MSRLIFLNPLPHRGAFDTFSNRADPDQAAPERAYGNMIRYDPKLVDLTSNFFVLCTNVKVHLYNYS